ncbi:MAG: hypothetical protein H6822_22430 [Planctomycetaceae bacterium]|nr:hypothetical protein [Planctomycetales bacterium]MCB9924953.1 hypothetical protein [Planctomycetaceae bacterium]
MNRTLDVADMTPDERFAELVAIFARGVLRARRLPQSASENYAESGQNPLDVPSETVLSVTDELTVPRVSNTRSKGC